MGKIRADQHGYLLLDFMYSGVRCREGTKLKNTPKNRKLLEKKLAIVENEIALGIFDYKVHFPQGNKLPIFDRKNRQRKVYIGEFASQWFEEKKPSLKISNIKTHQSSLNYISSYFKDCLLADVGEPDILSFRAYLSKTLTLKGKPLSFEEVKIFLMYVPADYHAFFFTAFMTGMRPNELIALKGINIDFVNKKICVREGRVLVQEGPPKTDASIRDIDLSPELDQILISHKARTFLKGSYVFLNCQGKPIKLDTLRRRIWEPTLKRAGLRWRTPYQTRHTFATLALSSGKNPNWVARQMGHTNTETLFKNYNKFIPNLTRQDGRIFYLKFCQPFCQPQVKLLNLLVNFVEKF